MTKQYLQRWGLRSSWLQNNQAKIWNIVLIIDLHIYNYQGWMWSLKNYEKRGKQTTNKENKNKTKKINYISGIEKWLNRMGILI
jgi:hypothetical protein